MLGGEVALLPLAVILPLIAYASRSRAASVLLGRLLLATYLAVLVGLTFFPLPLPPLTVDGPSVDLNLRPLRTIGPALDFGPGSQQFRLLVGNLLAFVPLGLLVPLARPRRHSWASVAVLGLALTVAIEVGQLLVSVTIGYAYRSADIDDVIVNWLGAGLGYAAYRLAAAIIPGRSP